MRVLHMLPDIGIANGVMSVILNYAKAMPSDIKFDVVYLLDMPTDRRNDIEELGGKVYKLDGQFPVNVLTFKFNDFFAKNKGVWDAVHIHVPYYSVFIVPGAKKSGINKICCHCHSTWYSLEKSNDLRNKILYNISKYFIDTKFACGRDAGRFWYGSDENFTVLNNAVDCSSLVYNESVRLLKRQELGIDDKFVVGHLGRTIPPQKNHPFLIEIFSQICKKNENSVLLLAGAEKSDELENICKKYGVLDKVKFLGNRTDVHELLQAFDVFVFPSFKEGLPVAVVEAQASGLPVVMSDSITNEVVVTDNVVSLSLNESANNWANKIIEISKSKRQNTLQTMKSSGWDIYSSAQQLVKYYRS